MKRQLFIIRSQADLFVKSRPEYSCSIFPNGDMKSYPRNILVMLQKLEGSNRKKGKTAVCCLGGDGTLGEVIRELDPMVRVGFFPTGTVNLFAMNLHIPELADPWLNMFENGKMQEVFVGEANGVPFLNVGSVGFDALVASKGISKSETSYS